jgi:ectoine hydroxylase-related dioxygenase (phytanoyl-CoA dioxygenase family)
MFKWESKSSLNSINSLTLKTDRPEWLRSIDERGYALIPDVWSAREVLALLVSLADLSSRPGQGGIRHVLHHPVVSVIANDRRLQDMAQTVLGENAFPFRATLFDKSPDANWLVSWHQDTALPLVEKIETPGWGPWSVKDGFHYAHAPAYALNKVLALRLHFDDSTPANGPLRVLSGTHRMGVLTDDDVARLAAELDPVECLIAKGDIMAIRPLLIHASSKSQTQIPRRILHIEYATPGIVPQPLQLSTT